jgi:Mg2+/Co2+ transporter CorB
LNDSSLELLFGILVACLLMSAFFSASETGMMTLNRYRLKHLRKNHRGARLAARLLERPDRLLGLILIGNTLVNILAGALATVLAVKIWGEAGIAIATALVTIAVLIFGEVTPKTLAALHPERIALPAAYVLDGLMYLLSPAVWCINQVSNGLLKLFGIDTDKRPEDALSSEELRTIVGEAGPMIPPRHKRMLLNILDLEEVTVDDIMIPRNEIRGIDLEEDDARIIGALRESEHTRVVLYREDIGNILGVLHLRSVGLFLHGDQLDREAMQRVATEPYFVPEGTPLNTQLLNFQKLKRRMGIVVDEYGSVRGMVTLEDILEEIVGEFTSNIGDQSPDIVPQPDGSFVIDGATAIRELNRTLHWELPVDGPKTLNGLILEFLETIPEAQVGMRMGPYHFEILELQGKAIQKVRASRTRGG